jgi:hypothetical protein
MHTYIKYDAEDPAANDAKALKDIKEFLGTRRWKVVVGAAKASSTAAHVQHLNIAFGFAGITGFPFYAFCRKYCPEALALWYEHDWKVEE